MSKYMWYMQWFVCTCGILYMYCYCIGRVRFLICTDIAARGIDVKGERLPLLSLSRFVYSCCLYWLSLGLPFMINMTVPDEVENYIHRIGRVGELRAWLYTRYACYMHIGRHITTYASQYKHSLSTSWYAHYIYQDVVIGWVWQFPSYRL